MNRKLVKVGAKNYSITCVDSKESPIFSKEDKIDGYIDYGECLISIKRDSLDPVFQQETLIHELLHALFYDSGMDEFNNDKIIAVLAPRLMDLLVKNPKFQSDLLSGKFFEESCK